ncbi:MAG: SulP family inorganic anion transporter [Thiotrichaceae bacterium]|nr:SulP family inorganic anion transporter [Thiotrichaceae bacterium]
MSQFLLGLLSDAGRRFVPYKNWLGELTNPQVLRADIIAGITVAMVLIPQAMAYAQLAGLPPKIGLYAAFLVPIIAALFGSSRQLQNGPVAIISLMTAAALMPFDLGENTSVFIAYAAMLAILAGIIQLLLGLLRLGILVDFLSHPVIIGFTNAAAIVITSLQLSKLLGISLDKTDHLYETLWQLLLAIPNQTHLPTLMMGLGSIALLILFKKLTPKLPGILFTVIITTIIAWQLGYTGDVIGEIKPGLPSFVIPIIDWKDLPALIMPAFMIAILSFVEAFSIAKAVASKTRQHISANQEMVGKGLANITAGVTQGYAVSGSFSRTAVAFDAGAKTGFAAIVSGIIVGLTLMYFTEALFYLPVATLAAVILVAVIGMIQFEPFKHAWRVNPHDGFVALTVFIVTLALAPHLEWGIFVGILLSLSLYIYRTMQPHFAEVAMDEDGTYRDAHLFGMETSPTLAIFRYDGDLYFANASYLEKKLLNAVADKQKLKVLILDLEAVDQIDVTGEEMLTKMSEHLHEAGIEFFITRAKFKVTDALKRSGLYDTIGKEHFYSKRLRALEDIQEKYGDAVDISHLVYHKPVEDITDLEVTPIKIEK